MIVTPKSAIEVARGHKSLNEVSVLMGKSENYATSMMARRSIGAQVMVDMLDALDYDTLIRNRSTGEESRISPSREEMIVPHALTISIQDENLRNRIVSCVDDGTLEDKLKGLL